MSCVSKGFGGGGSSQIIQSRHGAGVHCDDDRFHPVTKIANVESSSRPTRMRTPATDLSRIESRKRTDCTPVPGNYGYIVGVHLQVL
jgi:hypothetical protein